MKKNLLLELWLGILLLATVLNMPMAANGTVAKSQSGEMNEFGDKDKTIRPEKKADVILASDITYVALAIDAPPVSGEISLAGEQDYYQFTVITGGYYKIESWLGTITDSYMYLYGPNDSGLVIEEDDDGGENYASRIYRFLDPGTYYIAFFALDSGETGAYTIGVVSTATAPSTLAGRVTDMSAAGIANINVILFDLAYDLEEIVSTDANGDYLVTGLDAGSYKVRFSAPHGLNYDLEWYNDKNSFATADAVVLPANGNASANAQLAPGGQISGRVTDVFATAIQTVQVRVYNADGTFLGYEYTDAGGNYSVVGLPSGDHKVRFYRSGFVTEWYNDKAEFSTADGVAVAAGNTTPDINAQLQANTLTVSAPNGGENWTAGTSQEITWTSTGTIANIMIEYSTNNGTDWSVVIASTPNDGSYSWTVPDTPSASCTICISDVAVPPTNDGSDAAFTISAAVTPMVTVTSPNGGENWTVGSSQNVTWTSTGAIAYVRIECSTNNGTAWSDIVASTANDGTYAWTVPNSPSINCLIRVSDAANMAVTDTSDAIFTISGSIAAGTWTQKSPTLNPAARYSSAMAYDGARGEVLLFGGGISGSFFNDTWSWDGSSWAQKNPALHPMARWGAAMAYDAARGQVVLFGGRTYNEGYQNLNDTWIWDGSNWAQASPTSSPPATSFAAMAYDAAREQVVLFGGNSATGTWVWDGSNWTQKIPANSPPARSSSAMAYDAAHEEIVLFGGLSSVTYNDTWVWDGSNWTQKSPANSPQARWNHAMACDTAHGQVMMFGGKVQPGNIFKNDTWIWDGSDWTQDFPALKPRTRYGHAMAYDVLRGQVVLFGGVYETYILFPVTTYNSLNDTWIWVSTNPSDGISVTAPNGGESWMAGESHDITWTSTGAIANVNIDYSTNSGSSWTSVVAGTANDGTYAWTVPNTPSMTSLVRVSDAANAGTSDSSNAMFTILAIETVSAPTTPAGPATGIINTSYDYSTGGSTSSLGHSVQYNFDWDDGSDSGWLAQGVTTASHSWAVTGTYNVRAMARCATHTGVESLWSTTLAVIIYDGGGATGSYNSPAQYKVLPEVIWANAAGGGTWMSSVQVNDVTGGSQVSVYYNTANGRRGPFLLWDNSAGPALSSMKFDNLLEAIDTIDAGTFTYYGTVGAVEFITQDGSHAIHAAARTVNGSYAKTFTAVSLHDANTADSSRTMIIPNLVNNATYRSSCGFFNPTDSAVTIELKLRDATNTQVGTTISKTLAAHEFIAYAIFTDSGIPYPANSYDNIALSVEATSGTGKVVCFGASANNTSNDPATHVAVQNASSYDNGPSNLQVMPEAVWASASGGGTWVTEVQIVDTTGGSMVSVYFNYSGGVRRGPFALWFGTTAGSKVKYANILQQLGTLDGSYTYYGKGGAVEFVTQDGAHTIQVTARTLNGNYAKTFPGLNTVDAETADTARVMLVQNYTNNVTYRSTCGFYNPTADSITVEYTLLNGSGAQIGSPFSKTLVGHDFVSFSPFAEAGVAYPANSYDNVILRVRPTSGAGAVMCFGASANNASNDPASHLAVQGE